MDISTTYTTQAGEMLDAIAYRVYGTTQAVHAILQANTRAARYPALLPSGLVLVLPPRPTTTAQPAVVRLWG